MGTRFLTSAAVLFVFLTSCATTTNQYLSSDYSNPIENSTVAVLPIQAEYFFKIFPNYAFGQLDSNQAEMFNSYLPSFIERNSNSDVKGVLSTSKLSEIDFEMKELDLRSNEKLNIIGPKEKRVLKANDQESRFILILDQYNYQVYTIETGGGNYAGHEIEKQLRLRFETKYLIWDNELGKAAAWGKVNAVRKYSSVSEEGIYRDLLDDVILQIIQKSPFS